jgi:S-adenosylmethionine-dependent methyltransferase
MPRMIARAEEERFHKGAEDYAAYLKTTEGRLRSDLSFRNLMDLLPQPPGKQTLTALDVGCGTGAAAFRLAQAGMHVTMLDSSDAMLDLAKAAAKKAEVAIALKLGDATQLASLFPAGSFDVIICHNLLEYMDEPVALLQGVAHALRDSSAIVSILVRNRAGEVLKAAIQSGDLAAAENALTAEWGQESLYGGKVRLFTSESLRAMLQQASLEPIAGRGVRVLADYLPKQISRDDEYHRILELETKLGSRSQYASIARYIQCFAKRNNNDPGNASAP